MQLLNCCGTTKKH